ncbi:RNase J family beta-CASP ribonuclease, partial [Aquipuribacter sp. MA13-13]
ADLAIRTGVPETNVMIAEDGVVVDLVKGVAAIVGKVRAGYVYVDGATVGGATEASLKDRVTLSEEGVITVVALVDADTGELTEAPDFIARGFAADVTSFDAVVPMLRKTLAKAASEGIGDAHLLEQLIARTVSTWAHRTYRRSPLVIPVVVDA